MNTGTNPRGNFFKRVDAQRRRNAHLHGARTPDRYAQLHYKMIEQEEEAALRSILAQKKNNMLIQQLQMRDQARARQPAWDSPISLLRDQIYEQYCQQVSSQARVRQKIHFLEDKLLSSLKGLTVEKKMKEAEIKAAYGRCLQAQEKASIFKIQRLEENEKEQVKRLNLELRSGKCNQSEFQAKLCNYREKRLQISTKIRRETQEVRRQSKSKQEKYENEKQEVLKMNQRSMRRKQKIQYDLHYSLLPAAILSESTYIRQSPSSRPYPGHFPLSIQQSPSSRPYPGHFLAESTYIRQSPSSRPYPGHFLAESTYIRQSPSSRPYPGHLLAESTYIRQSPSSRPYPGHFPLTHFRPT